MKNKKRLLRSVLSFLWAGLALSLGGCAGGSGGGTSSLPSDPQPSPPTGLSAAGGEGFIEVDWTGDGVSYSVYRSTKSSGGLTRIASNVSSTSYRDSSVSPSTYYYAVTSKDQSGRESAFSEEVSATPMSAAPAPAAPTGLAATGGVGQISLNWNDNSETDLAGYSVYRSTSAQSGFTLLAQNVTASNYTDSSVGSGTYYYTVTAVNQSAKESAESDIASAQATQVPASPFEGFGSVTSGAQSSPDGFQVYHVTSLADSGAGTLRDAVSQGKRSVVFDLAGTITVTSDLEVQHSYVTIDGLSAPAPGITISQVNGAHTAIEGYASIGPVHDVIVHHLRHVGQGGVGSNLGDIWGLDGGEAPVSRVIIDHITATSSSDGIFDIYGDVKDVTISWNLLRDTVVALNIYTPDTSLTRTGLSIHHNVFARNNERQVKIRYNSQMDYVNNVVYGWGWFEGLQGSLNIAYDSGVVNPSCNIEDSVLLYVATPSGHPAQAIYSPRGPDQGQLYFNGNIVPPEEVDAVSTGGRLSIPAYAEVTHYSASTLATTVVPLVGTHYPTADELALLSLVESAM